MLDQFRSLSPIGASRRLVVALQLLSAFYLELRPKQFQQVERP
jgi:hypothetical protein